MFYVLLACGSIFAQQAVHYGEFTTGEPDLLPLLDLVAVGTVADLVPLDVNNRALVRPACAACARAGLRRPACPDRSLATRPSRTDRRDIGYAIGPH
jgi:single-stranded-DNA-specific exonuclease